MSEVDISGLDKADLLAALFNAAKSQGLGFSVPGTQEPMTKEQAQYEINNIKKYQHDTLRFDYVRGRVIKCDLFGDKLRTGGYNRDNGEGAAETVVDSVRQGITMASRVSQPTNLVEELAAAGRADESFRAANLSVFRLDFSANAGIPVAAPAPASSAEEDIPFAATPAPAPAPE